MPYTHLSSEERRVIFHCFAYGLSRAEIGRRLGRDRSTISREIKRGGRRGKGPVYDGIYAQMKAEQNRRQPRHRRCANNRQLVAYVNRKLRLHWPPEAISGRLAIDYPDRPDMRISHERIYQWIETDSRAQGTLHQYLRRRHKYRRRRPRLPRLRGQLARKRSIEHRPAIVDRRQRFGDWEGDTIWGKNNSGAIATHVERKSGYLVAIKLTSRHAEPLADATIAAFRKLPRKWRHTLTYDNGTEFSGFTRISQGTGLTVYFAKPHAPWQRGCNENLNGLLRQFYRKGSALSQVEQSDVDNVVRLLNHRPRKRLNYLTPHEVLKQGRSVAVGS